MGACEGKRHLYQLSPHQWKNLFESRLKKIPALFYVSDSLSYDLLVWKFLSYLWEIWDCLFSSGHLPPIQVCSRGSYSNLLSEKGWELGHFFSAWIGGIWGILPSLLVGVECGITWILAGTKNSVLIESWANLRNLFSFFLFIWISGRPNVGFYQEFCGYRKGGTLPKGLHSSLPCSLCVFILS